MTTRIAKVTVLGTGVLGSQIAYQTAYSGLELTAYDISDAILEKARNGFAGLAARYEQEVEGASGGSAQAALTRIGYSSKLDDAVRDADLVIESAPERLDIKRGLYTRLAEVAPKQAIFVTNSSTLLPSDLADATGRPDRFHALHSANLIWVHNTAEIMGHAHTDPTSTMPWSTSRAGSAWCPSNSTKSNPAMSSTRFRSRSSKPPRRCIMPDVRPIRTARPEPQASSTAARRGQC